MSPMLNILALSGSLRKASHNTAVLRAAQRLSHHTIEIWDHSGQLPHFSPDLEAAPPALVTQLRSKAGSCDGLLIACPEYMRAIPGSFKNLLDWLVGGETFINKKVALWNTSPRATEAQKSLRTVLGTMSAQIIESAGIQIDLLSTSATVEDILNDAVKVQTISQAIKNFAKALNAAKPV